MDTELLSKQSEWKKAVKDIRDIIDTVNIILLFIYQIDSILRRKQLMKRDIDHH